MSEQIANLEWHRPSDLNPSKLQPRKKFPKGSIRDMALSLWEHGPQEPLKARPLPDGSLELVFGERRWRGAALCEDGIDADHPAKEILLPVMVEELSDQDAFKIQVIENVEREDLSPIEEAEAYRRMQEMGGLSIRQLAAAFGGRIKKNRIHSMLRLLEIPPDWQRKIDSGDAPIYLVEEAFRVSEEQREAALEMAHDAGSRDHARNRIGRHFVRPAEERKQWGQTRALIPKEFSDEIEILSYDESREIFPFDVAILGRMGKAAEYGAADEFPLSEDLAEGKTANRTWREYAEHYGAPVYAVCDGRMETRLLVKKSLVVSSAVSFHEGAPCEACQGTGVEGEGDKTEACSECNGEKFSRKPSPELCPFPDQTPEGKRRQREEAERQKREDDRAEVERADEIIRMVSTLEIAVRARAGDPANARIMIEGSLLIMDGYLLGLDPVKSPAGELLTALERRARKGERPLAQWGEINEPAGHEAFCVCALALYWLDQSEADDLQADSIWLRIAGAYHVEL